MKISNFCNIYQCLWANIWVNMFPRERKKSKNLNLLCKISQITNKKRKINRSKKKKINNSKKKKSLRKLMDSRWLLKIKSKIKLIKQVTIHLKLKNQNQNQNHSLVFLYNLNKIKLNLSQNLLKNLMVLKLIWKN